MTGTAESPFDPRDAPETILLAHPPLVRVLVQIRFAPILAVANESFVGPFQQALVDRYPISSGDVEVAIALSPTGEPPTPTRLWRFASVDESSRVTLATSFVSFETQRYEGHEPFFADLETVLAATEAYVKPVRVMRLGIRYVQRLTEPADLARLGEYFRPELLGVVTAVGAAEHLDLCLTQARHSIDGVTLAARWGRLPGDAGLDVADPVPGPSWVFDIDVFDEDATVFDMAELVERAKRYSRRQYQFFRWAVEPSFLERFGAKPEDLRGLVAQA